MFKDALHIGVISQGKLELSYDKILDEIRIEISTPTMALIWIKFDRVKAIELAERILKLAEKVKSSEVEKEKAK